MPDFKITADRYNDANEKADGPSAFIRTALERFKLSEDAFREQRAREQEDLACQIAENLWTDEVKATRSAQTVGNLILPPRVMLSIPSLDQPMQLVSNEIQSAHLDQAVHPINEDAEDETADVIQGLYRTMVRDSSGVQCRGWAADRSSKCGLGAYRIVKEYDREGGSAFDQKLVFETMDGMPHLDPHARKLNMVEDAMWAFVTTDMAFDTYKQKYKDSAVAKYDDEAFRGLGEDAASWMQGDGPGRTVRVAEYFEVELSTRTIVMLADGTEADRDRLPAGAQILLDEKGQPKHQIDQEVRTVFWSLINCVEVIKPRQEWDGQYIPIFVTIGRKLQKFDQENHWDGIIRPNKEAARMLNYSASEAIQLAALESKAPYTGYEGQFEGHEREWLMANVRNFPYLEHRPVALPGGQVAPPPERTQADMSRLGPSMALLTLAQQFIGMGTSVYKSIRGDEDPSNKTKGGIEALQNQHQRANNHHLANLAEITLPYEAKVVLDLIPHIYDRPGRVARILDKQDNIQAVMLNAPFQPGPGKRPQAIPYGSEQEQQQARQMAADPKNPVKFYDLNKGRYGVSVSVGKSYQSRVEEGATEMGQILTADPALMPLIGPTYFKFRQFPGHLEVADILKKVRAQNFPYLEDDESDATKMQQENAQLKAAMQQMGMQLQEAGKIIETKQVEQMAKLETEKIKALSDQKIADTKADMELALQMMQNAATIAVAHINAASKGASLQAHAAEEAQALGQSEREAAKSRAHELAMGVVGHGQEQESGDREAQREAALAEQGHGHALEQADVTQQNALEQIAATPTPAPNGSGA